MFGSAHLFVALGKISLFNPKRREEGGYGRVQVAISCLPCWGEGGERLYVTRVEAVDRVSPSARWA